MKNNIALGISVLAIIGIIWYLESTKPTRLSSNASDLQVTIPDLNLSTDFGKSGKTGQKIELPNGSARLSVAEKAKLYPKAKELVDPTGFINSSPFKLVDIAGKKVILVDFWTYSCINCQRTTPYLNAWYEKYKDKGLEIVGVHTPEFEFEKDYNNVSQAVKKENIKYPVVMDSNRATWSAYQNSYWPRKYLVDIDGFIVYDRIGEGGYEETEAQIQKALAERALVLGINESIPSGMAKPEGSVVVESSKVGSSETYFGASRNEYLANGQAGSVGVQKLTLPENILLNSLYLGGDWNFVGEFAESRSASATIVYKYKAKNVYFVASSEQGTKVKITLDGKPVGNFSGKDILPDGTVSIKENRLYKIIEGADYGEHVLKIEIFDAGLQAFTFTFG